MNLSCTIKIGQTKITFQCPSKKWLNFIKRHYAPFILRNATVRGFLVRIAGEFSPAPADKKLSVERKSGKWAINRYDSVSRSSRDLKHTFLSVENNKYAFDSWLRIFFTLCGTLNGSMLLHGAGYSSPGGIFVFPGRSGTGKSTMIKILGKPGALTDELVCVFRSGKGYCAASTPFWGELQKGSGRVFSGRLSGLFFLRHGKNTMLGNVSRKLAVRNILKTAMFFPRDNASVKMLFNEAFGLATKVPSRVISFRKDSKREEILGLIRSETNENKD